jgi:hypothetical protein
LLLLLNPVMQAVHQQARSSQHPIVVARQMAAVMKLVVMKLVVMKLAVMKLAVMKLAVMKLAVMKLVVMKPVAMMETTLPARLVRRAHPVLQVHLVLQVLQVHLVLQAHLVRRVLQVLPAPRKEGGGKKAASCRLFCIRLSLS